MSKQTPEGAVKARIVVPLVAPSANHYKGVTRNGVWFVKKEAGAFVKAVGILAQGQRVRGRSYRVYIGVWLAAGQKGDVDNFAKVVLDSLTKSGVIDTDAKITRLEMEKFRDPANPRTEIEIEVIR